MKSMTGGSIEGVQAPSSRWEARDAQRKENARIAREAAAARHGRKKASLVERVEAAKEKLATANVAGAIDIIQNVSSQDYDFYIIAERTGQARRGVLRAFGPPRNTVEQQYLAEAGLGSPDHTPHDGVEE